MTTNINTIQIGFPNVVETYRLGKYDNLDFPHGLRRFPVLRGGSNVEAYRLGKYDNTWNRFKVRLDVYSKKSPIPQNEESGFFTYIIYTPVRDME